MDALTAGEAIRRFVDGSSLEDYVADELVIAGVERKFEILGGALGRALRVEPHLVDRIPDAVRVVGFRNVLAHGYDVVDDETVYQNATTELPGLLDQIRRALDEVERP